MYVYQKKYVANSVTLLYPLSHSISHDEKIKYITEGGNVVVTVKFIDLLNAKEEVNKILCDVLNS